MRSTRVSKRRKFKCAAAAAGCRLGQLGRGGELGQGAAHARHGESDGGTGRRRGRGGGVGREKSRGLRGG
jgi:hypothetical protein